VARALPGRNFREALVTDLPVVFLGVDQALRAARVFSGGEAQEEVVPDEILPLVGRIWGLRLLNPAFHL
jgi:hypothetical protein